MDYTTNYHLPQWAESDRIQMEDFNQMCLDMESGIDEAKDLARELPYAVGSYWGTSGEMTFDLGFRPQFLIISGAIMVHSSNTAYLSKHTLFTAGTLLTEVVTFTDTGFILHPPAENQAPNPVENRQYNYIAFR